MSVFLTTNISKIDILKEWVVAIKWSLVSTAFKYGYGTYSMHISILLPVHIAYFSQSYVHVLSPHTYTHTHSSPTSPLPEMSCMHNNIVQALSITIDCTCSVHVFDVYNFCCDIMWLVLLKNFYTAPEQLYFVDLALPLNDTSHTHTFIYLYTPPVVVELQVAATSLFFDCLCRQRKTHGYLQLHQYYRWYGAWLFSIPTDVTTHVIVATYDCQWVQSLYNTFIQWLLEENWPIHLDSYTKKKNVHIPLTPWVTRPKLCTVCTLHWKIMFLLPQKGMSL